jgi:hypothetical protein
MDRFLKTLLLWLLLAALPLQGIAAAVQTVCGSMEHHGSAAIEMSAQPHQHDDDVINMSRSNMASRDAADLKTAMLSNKSFDAKHKHAACNFCASCCIGAVAPPSTTVSASAHTHSLAVLFSPSPLVTGFVPAGLERPPKRITA